MEPKTREDSTHSGWHASEKRVEKSVTTYFKERGYRVTSHCCQDLFDVAAAKVEPGPRIDALIGIEIKSKNDTFKKFDSQIAEYLQIFDFVYVALETQEFPASLPPFVGIIRVSDENTTIERDAHKIGRTLFPWCLTDSALARTIKMSDGVQNRYMELRAYLSVLDDLRKKFLYNSVFWNDPLPLNNQEKNVIDFIEQKLSSISESGLFMYECGRVNIAGGCYGRK